MLRRLKPRRPASATPAASGTEDMDSYSGSLTAALRNRWALAAAVRGMAAASALCALVSLISLALAVWALTSKPEPRYFATRGSGELVQLVPLDQPHLSDAQAVNFAVDTMTRALTLDFANWRRELAGIEPLFTPEGYVGFLDELERSGTLDLIRNRRMTSSTVANGGVVVQKGQVGGGGPYIWRVEIPVTTTYQSASARQTQNTTLLVEITRVPTWTADWGVAVSRVIGQQRR